MQAHIIATERGPRGGRLVLIAENGERLADLTRIGPVPVRDNSPAWSPDRRWVVFASSRGRRTLVETSLWITAAEPGAEPRRLTSEAAVDRDPVWTPDGRAIVFASDRGGSFDLWRLELAPGPNGWPEVAGAPEPLTRGPDHELHPSPAPDGRRIAFMQVSRDASRSSLWLLGPDRTVQLTQGPADMTPAWSPDGSTIAFAAPSAKDDADLFAIRPDGSDRRPLVSEPLADQTGPVWSADGRFLFSTSLYRSVKSRKPVLSSITFVDLRESPPVVRALHDPVAVESRTSPAVDRAVLDVASLRKNLPYKEALRRAVEQALIRALDSDDQ